MTDLSDAELIDALRNPLLVTDERFDLTRVAAARIERLRAILGKAYQFISPLSDPMGITNKSMADEIMAAIAGKVQP